MSNANYYAGINKPLARLTAARSSLGSWLAKAKQAEGMCVGDAPELPSTNDIAVDGWGIVDGYWALKSPGAAGVVEEKFLSQFPPAQLLALTEKIEEMAEQKKQEFRDYIVECQRLSAERLASQAEDLARLATPQQVAVKLRALADTIDPA